MALTEIASTGEVGVRRHLIVVGRSAILCGALVATLGAIAATLATIGRRQPQLSTPTNWAVRILSNPLLWLTLVLGGFGITVLRNARSHTR